MPVMLRGADDRFLSSAMPGGSQTADHKLRWSAPQSSRAATKPVERAVLRATPAVLPAGPPALQAWRPAPPPANRCGRRRFYGAVVPGTGLLPITSDADH